MIIKKLQLIFTEEEINRITLATDKEELKVFADVHGMKCSQAKRFINNIINVLRIRFKLIVIHGYNHGTAIKDMLSENFTNDHIFQKCPDPYNQGITYMYII